MQQHTQKTGCQVLRSLVTAALRSGGSRQLAQQQPSSLASTAASSTAAAARQCTSCSSSSSLLQQASSSSRYPALLPPVLLQRSATCSSSSSHRGQQLQQAWQQQPLHQQLLLRQQPLQSLTQPQRPPLHWRQQQQPLQQPGIVGWQQSRSMATRVEQQAKANPGEGTFRRSRLPLDMCQMNLALHCPATHVSLKLCFPLPLHPLRHHHTQQTSYQHTELKFWRPTSPGTRGRVTIRRLGIWKGRPVRALSRGAPRMGGRNCYGRITVRHRWGGETRRG